MWRREFAKGLVVSITTLPVLPSFARAGSDVPGEAKDSAWNVINVAFDDGGLAILPAGQVGAGSWLIYPNKNTYNFQTGKQWVYMGVFGVDAVTPVSFPSLTFGANPIVLVPNL